VVRSNVPPFGTIGQAMIVDQEYRTRTDTKHGVATVGVPTHAVTPSDWVLVTVTSESVAFAPGVRLISASAAFCASREVGLASIA